MKFSGEQRRRLESILRFSSVRAIKDLHTLNFVLEQLPTLKPVVLHELASSGLTLGTNGRKLVIRDNLAALLKATEPDKKPGQIARRLEWSTASTIYFEDGDWYLFDSNKNWLIQISSSNIGQLKTTERFILTRLGFLLDRREQKSVRSGSTSAVSTGVSGGISGAFLNQWPRSQPSMPAVRALKETDWDWDGPWLRLPTAKASIRNQRWSRWQPLRASTALARVRGNLDQLGSMLDLGFARRNDGRLGYPSAGGLYDVDLVVDVQKVDGLEAGLYFYDRARHAIRRVNAVTRLPTPHAENYCANFFLVSDFRKLKQKYGKMHVRLGLLDTGVLLHQFSIVFALNRLSGHAVGFNADCTSIKFGTRSGKPSAKFLLGGYIWYGKMVRS